MHRACSGNKPKYIADKDKKDFANNLKAIYHVPDEQTARTCLDKARTTREARCLGCMNRSGVTSWDYIRPMFKFSQAARKVMYTTNAIESLNNNFRRLNFNRTIFLNAMELLKVSTWQPGYTFEIGARFTRN